MNVSNATNIPWERQKTQRFLKRGMDLAASLTTLVICSPLMLLFAVLIKATSPGPVFFKQKRLGFKGDIFSVIKLRTMVDRAWEQGAGLSVSKNDPRITWIGRILRIAHLDELPQLLNVLKGDMSLVGPRPTLPYQYDYYEHWEKQRLDMPPGITGWAQANGATAIGWDERIKLDVWYVQQWSLWLDAKILARTCVHVLARIVGNREIQPPGDCGWTRGMSADPFTHSGMKSRTI